MAQEEHFFGCSYSGGGGSGGGGNGGGGGGGSGCGGGVSSSRSKTAKQKKVPQRGLGVAQLEKIRLEEQQKKESLQVANILAKNSVGSSSDNAQFLAVQCSKFRPGLSPLHKSDPNLEILHENSVQIPKNLNAGGGEIGVEAISSPGHENRPIWWNGEYNLPGEKQRLGTHGFAFEPQVSLPYQSNSPFLPLPVVPQRSQQFQWPCSSSSSVMNSSTGISASSILSSQMEPPSNQSSRGNNYVPSWSEEEKMVGMKRSYPFLVESQPSRSLHCNFHPSYAASLSRSDEFDSCSNGYKAHMEPRNKCVRESSSNSSPQPEQNPSEVTRDKGMLNGDFLTLAPPVVVSQPSNSEHKNTLDYSGYKRPELYPYERIPSQDYAKSQIRHPGPSGLVERAVSFLPITLQIDQTTTSVSNGNGEKTETIDHSLKL
ncbi:uncharacterized protein LOC105176957 [Sesamum indicum]|uniref:Uncharacterized protein LOC105176957 n=1 Tax=Sesamum indicum TaxID=4182 RepID=A0A6I9UJP7_SESIN|nr:uncharacterized protein LOC105176957 [Sesamum indicum]